MSETNNLKLTLISDGSEIIVEGKKIILETKDGKVIIQAEKLNKIITGNTTMKIEMLDSKKDEVQELKSDENQKDTKTLFVGRIEKDDYDYFMKSAGESIEKKLKAVRTAQFKIIYTLLYFCAVNLHELIQLTKDDLVKAIQTGDLNIYDPETNICTPYTLSEDGNKSLTKLAPEIELIFDLHGFQFLGNSKIFSDKTFSPRNFIRFVDDDIKKTCEKYQLRKLNHNSFRIGTLSKKLGTGDL